MDYKNPKYISEIKNSLEHSLSSVQKKASPLLEHQQNYSDEKLEIYKKAFDSLIAKVVNSNDILKSIKDAYETSLRIRDERISMFIAQDKIFGISSTKEWHDQKHAKLVEENKLLNEQHHSVLAALAKAKGEIGKLHMESFSEHAALAEEREARYTLFFENAQLHARLRALDGSGAPPPHARADPLVLRIALDKCREQLTVTQRNLTTMAEEYSDTVPRHNYDALELNYLELTKTAEKQEQEHQALLEKHRRVLSENASLKEEISELKERCSELERAGTPRPRWDECGDFIGGGGARWRQLRRGLSSRDTLRVILRELGPSAKTEHLEYFDGLLEHAGAPRPRWDECGDFICGGGVRWRQLRRGLSSRDTLRVILRELGPSAKTEHLEYFDELGLDPVIPPYLQYEGKIRNLRLSRRELSVIINDIWVDKIHNGNDSSMQEYVTLYFENRYQQASVRAEWAYNLCCGAEQMLDDPQIKLFWGVLHGHLSEDIYVAHRREWYTLRDSALRQSHDDEIISAEKFEKVAKTAFPLKSEVDIKNLLDVAKKQLKLKSSSNEIEVGKLFQENEEGFDRTEFARELYRQRQAAQDKYIREIVAELGGKNAPNKMITVENLKRAFALTDPAIDHIRMEKNIRWAFSDKKSDLSMIYPLPLKVLAAKLAAGNIERAGARDKGRRLRKVAYKH